MRNNKKSYNHRIKNQYHHQKFGIASQTRKSYDRIEIGYLKVQ